MTSEHLLSIWGAAADEVWAVGGSGTALRFNGTTWMSDAPAQTQTLQVVWGLGVDSVWAAGSGNQISFNDGTDLYIAGDTALTYDMKLLPMQCKLDLAVLPIGDNFTMGCESAVIASEFIECNRVMGYHYDTFGYIVIDHESAKKTFADAGKELILLPIGDSMEV